MDANGRQYFNHKDLEEEDIWRNKRYKLEEDTRVVINKDWEDNKQDYELQEDTEYKIDSVTYDHIKDRNIVEWSLSKPILHKTNSLKATTYLRVVFAQSVLLLSGGIIEHHWYEIQKAFNSQVNITRTTCYQCGSNLNIVFNTFRTCPKCEK